ncbi:MAG: sugar ABC transporter ATP-binding protein [Aestuariivirga sp.]|nr:sugar ABC transporter ATP-binding protein [Aestuariivirga sp.]
MAAPPLIRGTDLSKVYGTLTALNNTNFTLMPSEVRALIGANGAGKSTLIKILTGAIAPTSGTVEISGTPVALGDPRAMIRNGLACIYQHANLAPDLSVLDNIFLGRQPTSRFGLVNTKAQRSEAQALMARHGIEVDVDVPVGNLPTVKQKEVEILKALALNARIILMDEPTAWLSASEVTKLHETVRALKSTGVGIVYISHVLDEIFAVCDTLTILRDGKVVAETDVAKINRPSVVELMVGEKLARDSAQASSKNRHPRGTGEIGLSVRNLTKHGVYRDISFDLYAGEILCITGLIGSKRTELLQTLFGTVKSDSGTVSVTGAPAVFRKPSHAMARGIGLVPEDRHRDGLMLGMTVTENLALATLAKFLHGLFLSSKGMAEAARASIADLSIRPPDGRHEVGLLSGGNQQKVLVGKWLNLAPKVLILDEPTVGVDVGAKAEIYGILRRERERGKAILVVSSDLEEVLTIADRIAVMVSGSLVALHDAGAIGSKELVREIGGIAA